MMPHTNDQNPRICSFEQKDFPYISLCEQCDPLGGGGGGGGGGVELFP